MASCSEGSSARAVTVAMPSNASQSIPSWKTSGDPANMPATLRMSLTKAQEEAWDYVNGSLVLARRLQERVIGSGPGHVQILA